jgi:hypothetical protein
MAGKNINFTVGKITTNSRSLLLKKSRVILIIITLNEDNRYLSKEKKIFEL